MIAAQRSASVLFALAAIAGLRAQDLAAAQELATKATADVVAAFHATADALAAQKQFGRALQLRRELVQEWAPGDKKALAALGFVQVGELWRRDGNIVVQDRDLRGDAKALKKIDQEWTKTQKELIKSVERAAQALTAAGAAEPAMVFWRRLLRLKPGDPKATSALQLPAFDGHPGTPDELRVLRRGRLMHQAVQFASGLEVPATRIEVDHPVLKKAGIAYTAVATDHFRICGTLPEDKLRLAAAWAERSLLVARTMIGCEGGEVGRPKDLRNIVLCGDKGSYHRVIDACADQFDKDRIAFLKQYVELAFIDVAGDYQRVYALTNGGDDLMNDVVARGVTQDAIGLKADGLWEGLGHAICGFLFDRTLSFFVEQQTGHTVTSWVPKPLLPEMGKWREMATESAWAKNDTPTARLVLLDGAKMTNEERVKAWAMVDYLVRTRPQFLRLLDASKKPEVRDPLAVEAAFRQLTGVDLRTIDDEWRTYWAKGEALRAAMEAPPQGAAPAVDGAKAIAYAIDRARARADVGPSGFLVADNADTKAVLDWLQQLLRHEQEKKDPKKKDLPPPPPPVCLGATVLLARVADAETAVTQWMAQPALRDHLLHPGRAFFVASAAKNAQMLDLTQPATPIERGLPSAWPRQGQVAVPAQVAVQALGPAFAAPLAAAGIAADAVVGTAVTLHFHRELTAEQQKEVACSLRVGGLERRGVFVPLQDADGLAAPGCFAFVPNEPLPAGEVEVRWQLPKGFLAKDERYAPITFRVQ